MTDEGKVEDVEEKEEKDDAEVVDDPAEQPEGEQPPEVPKEGEIEKEEESFKDDTEVEYRRKSFHARPYASKTIDQTQKEVEDLIVKKTRYYDRFLTSLDR